MDGAMIPIIAVLGGMMIGGAGLFGWIHTTRLKIKHGYPLETMWGVPIHPSNSEESTTPQAADAGKCPAARRTRVDQGSAGQRRADRDRQRILADPRNRISSR